MELTINDKMKIFNKTNGQCHLCGSTIFFLFYGDLLSRYGWEIDHARPQSMGGSDRLANLWPAHPSCNRTRQDTPLTKLFTNY